jgi:hypothetical protein
LKEELNLIIKDIYIYPSQEPQPEDGSNKPKNFDFDKDFYLEDVWYPDDNCNISDTMIMRELCIAHFGVCPFKYNPKRRQLKTVYKLSVNIIHKERDEDCEFNSPGYVDVEFADMYEDIILNYKFLNLPEVELSRNFNYLIVTHPDFINQAQDLKTYLETKFPSYSIHIEQINTSNWNIIYDYIKGFYQNNNNTYVLLIGDVDKIPIPYREWENPQGGIINVPSDMVYACLEEDDVIPEVALGRLSVDNLSEANRQVNKIKDHYDYYNPDRILEVILVAHQQKEPQDPFPYYWPFIQCKWDIFLKCYDWDPNITYLWGSEEYASTDYLIDCINDVHYMVINYRGHGHYNCPVHYGGCWSFWCNIEPYCFRQSKISNVNPGKERPVVFSISCYTGKIDKNTGDCFCEEWMNVPGGAVGIIGATETTYTIANTPFDKYIFDSLYNNSEGHIGKTQNWAKLEMLKHLYGGDSYEYGIKSHLSFLLLGDPSLHILPPMVPPNQIIQNNPSDNSKFVSYLKDSVFQLDLYPNPIANDILTIILNSSYDKSNSCISIYDISGRLVYEGVVNIKKGENIFYIDLQELEISSGIQFVNISIGDKKIIEKFVFINK